jgi:hypothetical protein
MATMDPAEQARLFDRLPDLRGDAQTYGSYARRVLSDGEAAILRHDAGWQGYARGAA